MAEEDVAVKVEVLEGEGVVEVGRTSSRKCMHNPAANSAVSALDPQRIPLTSDIDVNESRVCHRLLQNDSNARPSTLLI